MVKHTPSDAVGYNDIMVALSTMTGIAHHINTMKRRHEHAVRVQEVQSLLTGWQVRIQLDALKMCLPSFYGTIILNRRR